MSRLPHKEMPLRTRVALHVGQFSLGSIIGGVAAFINQYVAALVLGPSIWGIWQGALVAKNYGALLHFGVLDGLQRELPVLRSRSQSEHPGPMMTNAAFSVTWIAALIAAGLITGGAMLAPATSAWGLSLWLVAVMVFFQYFFAFTMVLLQVDHRFDVVTRTHIFGALGSLAGVGLTYLYGLVGFLVMQAVVIAMLALYAYRNLAVTPRWQWSSQMLWHLLKSGLPIMLISLSGVLLLTVDRLLILRFLDEDHLAYYSLGRLIFSPFYMVINAAQSVLYARFTEQFGRTGSDARLVAYLTAPLHGLSLLLTPALGVMFAALPWLTKVFLPAYAPGLAPTRLLLFGLYFYAMSGLAQKMLLAVGHQALTLGLLAGTVGLSTAMSYLALQTGLGLVGVAAGTGLAFLLLLIVSCYMALRVLRASAAEMRTIGGRILWPVIVVTGVLVLFQYLPLPGGSFGPMAVALQVLVLAVSFAGPLLRFHQQIFRAGR